MNGDLQNAQPTMTVEEVRGSLDLTDSGAIKNSIRNCLTVFQNDPILQGAVRFNILTERIDIVKPLWWSKQTATLNDTDFNYLMLYLEDKYGLTSEKKIQKAISIIADCNKYTYYANGLRKTKTVDETTTTYGWDGDRLVYESGMVIHSYIYGLSLIAYVSGSTDTYYLHDAHGNVVVLRSIPATAVSYSHQFASLPLLQSRYHALWISSPSRTLLVKQINTRNTRYTPVQECFVVFWMNYLVNKKAHNIRKGVC